MKLIDADKLMETIRKHSYLMLSEDWDERAYAMTVAGIEQIIAEQSEAMVRCRDCVYRYENEINEKVKDLADYEQEK